MQTEKLGKFTENCYSIMVGDTCTILDDISFKELYKFILGHKSVDKT